MSPGSAAVELCDLDKLLNLSEADAGTTMLLTKAPSVVPATEAPSPVLLPTSPSAHGEKHRPGGLANESPAPEHWFL